MNSTSDRLRQRTVVALSLLTVAVVSPGAVLGTAPQEPGPPADAIFYAKAIGVTVEEAEMRLALQGDAGYLEGEVSGALGSRFAGAYLIHEPRFELIVLSTSPSDEALVSRSARGTPLEAAVRFGTKQHSLAELTSIAESIHDNNPGMVETEVNVPENLVEVYYVDNVTETSLAAATASSDGALRFHRVPMLSRPTADIYGGLPTGNLCTFGFTVKKNGSTTKGITTAGHCPDNQSYNGVNLPFKAERVGGQGDEQWHTTPGFTPRNKIQYVINGDPILRTITVRRGSADQVIGALYCKSGRTTNYGCGYLNTKTFNPVWIPNGNSFHVLGWQGLDLASGGDSGGPVFYLGEALGTISGETIHAPFDIFCACRAVYGAIDRVEGGIGVTVLTQ